MDELVAAIVNVAVAVVPLAIIALGTYLTVQAKTRMAPGAARDAILEGIAVAEVVVRNLEQTIKPELLKRAADGKLSREDGLHLKEVAVAQLKQQWSDQSQAVVVKGGAKLQALLEQLIESQVSKAKDARPSEDQRNTIEVPAVGP